MQLQISQESLIPQLWNRYTTFLLLTFKFILVSHIFVNCVSITTWKFFSRASLFLLLDMLHFQLDEVWSRAPLENYNIFSPFSKSKALVVQSCSLTILVLICIQLDIQISKKFSYLHCWNFLPIVWCIMMVNIYHSQWNCGSHDDCETISKISWEILFVVYLIATKLFRWM